MEIFFLSSSHDIKAVKKFTTSGVQSYPQIKAFTSNSITIAEKDKTGLEQKLAAMRKYATEGACLLKGQLADPIVNESRKGKVNADTWTENVIFDIDGIILPGIRIGQSITREQLESIAETVVAMLPPVFHNVSYIAHSSSSMGLKGDKISLHLDFWLKDPIHPKTLKEYLVALNFKTPQLCGQFELSASGTALHYPLDRCLADNSRLIYIGNPEFDEGIGNPIPNMEDRIFAMVKPKFEVDLEDEITEDITHAHNRKLINAKVNELRQAAGLPQRKEVLRTVSVDGFNVHVVANPDQSRMRIAEDRGEWVTYNINAGDSSAYYVNKYNPTVVYNFKSEPNFLFEQADKEAYYHHLDTYVFNNEKPDPNQEPVYLPLVFRDYESSGYYNGLLNTANGKVESINRSPREGLADFMVQYGAVIGENVPIWDYKFDPQDERAIDVRNRFVNKYSSSPLMTGKPRMPRRYVPLKYENSYEIEQFCPTIYKLIMHVVGGGMDEYLHFINWLAAGLQMKQKLGTCWIMQGCQGSGKGQLFERIIGPLVGNGIDTNSPYHIKLRQENIEDQFNGWEETALFAVFDEFRLNDSTQTRRMLNKIKNMITDEENTIRGMRENLRRVKLYTNFLIFTNDKDMIYIPEDDRRFNVGVRQEAKLESIFEDMFKTLYKAIPAELPMFGRIMNEFRYDEAQARKCLNNEAKKTVRVASSSSIEEFVEALKCGDLDYFLPIMDLPYSAPGLDYSTGAKLIIKGIINRWDNEDKAIHALSVDDIRILYCCLVGRSDNTRKFGKLLGHAGIEAKPLRFGKIVRRGIKIHWCLNQNNIEDVKAEYMDDALKFNPDKVTPLKQVNEE